MNARATAVLLLAAAAAAAGCIPNDASVKIHGLCFPPTPTETGVCSYPAACEALLLGQLEFETANASTEGALIWPVQVDNQRLSNADRPGAVETANGWIEGFKIQYAIPGLAVPDVDVPISRHPVAAEGSTVLIAPVVPSSLGVFLNGSTLPAGPTSMSAELRAYGRYGDGGYFETGPFNIAITAWKGGASLTPGCPDPANPILAGVCPQAQQTGVGTCVAPAAP